MYSTHRQPRGCINSNTFRQALGFLGLNSPLYCEGGKKKKKVDCFKCCKGSYLCKTRIISQNKNEGVERRQVMEGTGWGKDNNYPQKPAPVGFLA